MSDVLWSNIPDEDIAFQLKKTWGWEPEGQHRYSVWIVTSLLMDFAHNL